MLHLLSHLRGTVSALHAVACARLVLLYVFYCYNIYGLKLVIAETLAQLLYSRILEVRLAYTLFLGSTTSAGKVLIVSYYNCLLQQKLAYITVHEFT